VGRSCAPASSPDLSGSGIIILPIERTRTQVTWALPDGSHASEWRPIVVSVGLDDTVSDLVVRIEALLKCDISTLVAIDGSLIFVRSLASRVTLRDALDSHTRDVVATTTSDVELPPIRVVFL